MRAGPADSFILHLFGQGFPKGPNISKTLSKLGSEEASKWVGFGTTLKPAVETWWLARKPLRENTIGDQLLSTGTGVLNIDECRIGSTKRVPGGLSRTNGITLVGSENGSLRHEVGSEGGHNPNLGRWPSNVTLEHGIDCKMVVGNPTSQTTEVADASQSTWNCSPSCPIQIVNNLSYHKGSDEPSQFFNNFEPDSEANPFLYTGKISSSERKEDLEEEGLINKHKTVKSKKLMSHLVKLITPPEGVILDPFSGSGSTIVAAIEQGFSGVGIEKEVEFHSIAVMRVESALSKRAGFDLMLSLESE